MQTLKKSFVIFSMAALLALGTATLLPSPALAACTPTPTTLDDFIVCDGTAAIIDGLAGNDTITNYGTISILSGNAGNDILTNYGKIAILEGNVGNDILINYGKVDIIGGNIGNDIITNYGKVSLINGNAGNDIITNYGVITILNGDAGNDSLINYGVITILDGNAGHDSLINYGVVTIIEGNTDNDFILNNGIVTSTINAGSGDDFVTLGRVFVMSGLIDGAADFDTLEFDTVGDTRADVRTLLQILADNKGEGTLTWHGATFSWVNFEALTGNVRYRNAVASDGLIRVTETLDSLLIIGLDKGKINIAVPVNFTRLKHVTDGQTIANFTDKDGYNLQLSVLSAEDNLWTVFYYAPDGALISSYSFEFDPIW